MRLNLGGLDKRKLARIVALVVVALSAGHLVQTLAASRQPQVTASAQKARPQAVVQLAATTDPVKLPPLASAPPLVPAPPLPAAAFAAPVPETPPAAVVVADPCPVTLDLMADPGAMIGLLLLAPCHPSERVVLRHAGLAVTVMTTATGSVFLTVPALQSDAVVDVRFADGTAVSGSLIVADLASIRRFGVQWQGDDAFQVYGIEPAGIVSAANPGAMPSVDLPLTNGYLTRLGDAAAPSPLLAEIYTYPGAQTSDVVIEAAVTQATCGREILGETLASVAGSVTVTDLTLTMPGCDAVGDFLVLNNLASDLTLAAAD